jgi:hypothetical protein
MSIRAVKSVGASLSAGVCDITTSPLLVQLRTDRARSGCHLAVMPLARMRLGACSHPALPPAGPIVPKADLDEVRSCVLVDAWVLWWLDRRIGTREQLIDWLTPRPGRSSTSIYASSVSISIRRRRCRLARRFA